MIRAVPGPHRPLQQLSPNCLINLVINRLIGTSLQVSNNKKLYCEKSQSQSEKERGRHRDPENSLAPWLLPPCPYPSFFTGWALDRGLGATALCAWGLVLACEVGGCFLCPGVWPLLFHPYLTVLVPQPYMTTAISRAPCQPGSMGQMMVE